VRSHDGQLVKASTADGEPETTSSSLVTAKFGPPGTSDQDLRPHPSSVPCVGGDQEPLPHRSTANSAGANHELLWHFLLHPVRRMRSGTRWTLDRGKGWDTLDKAEKQDAVDASRGWVLWWGNVQRRQGHFLPLILDMLYV
jgi:hypothetical protein